MELYFPNHPNRQSLFEEMTRCMVSGSRVLVCFQDKMWLFSRDDKSMSVRPIHGFVVEMVYHSIGNNGLRTGGTHTKYVAGVVRRNGEWYSHWDHSEIATADVFFSVKDVVDFVNQFEHHFFNLEPGKELFFIPVTVENGRAY